MGTEMNGWFLHRDILYQLQNIEIKINSFKVLSLKFQPLKNKYKAKKSDLPRLKMSI